MKIAFWGVYDKSKPRIRILLEGLQHINVDVEEYHCSIWEQFTDKSQIHKTFTKVKIIAKHVWAYPFLLTKLFFSKKPDVIIVAYPAMFDIFFILIYARFKKVPVVWDVFISLYNTIVEDRRLLEENSLLARILFRIEKLTLHNVDAVVMDTMTHGRYLAEKFELNNSKVYSVFVGAEMNKFLPCKKRKIGYPIDLLFYGQFIPLHGVESIVKAAEEGGIEKYRWTIIGKGQDSKKIARILKSNPIENLTWVQWVNYEDLILYINEADICLGIFGETIKSQLVIPNKVFQIIAAGRPFVTLDTPAMRELFCEGTDGLQFASSSKPSDILKAIDILGNSYDSFPDQLFAKQVDSIGPNYIATQYCQILNQILEPKSLYL